MLMVLNDEQGNLSEMFIFFLKWYLIMKCSQWNGILNFLFVNILILSNDNL